MTPTTDLFSSEAVPVKQIGEPPTAEAIACGSALASNDTNLRSQ